jgi:hypothetical protein
MAAEKTRLHGLTHSLNKLQWHWVAHSPSADFFHYPLIFLGKILLFGPPSTGVALTISTASLSSDGTTLICLWNRWETSSQQCCVIGTRNQRHKTCSVCPWTFVVMPMGYSMVIGPNPHMQTCRSGKLDCRLFSFWILMGCYIFLMLSWPCWVMILSLVRFHSHFRLWYVLLSDLVGHMPNLLTLVPCFIFIVYTTFCCGHNNVSWIPIGTSDVALGWFSAVSLEVWIPKSSCRSATAMEDAPAGPGTIRI